MVPPTHFWLHVSERMHVCTCWNRGIRKMTPENICLTNILILEWGQIGNLFLGAFFGLCSVCGVVRLLKDKFDMELIWVSSLWGKVAEFGVTQLLSRQRGEHHIILKFIWQTDISLDPSKSHSSTWNVHNKDEWLDWDGKSAKHENFLLTLSSLADFPVLNWLIVW